LPAKSRTCRILTLGPDRVEHAMTTEGYDSPESAAMEGFPPAHCRVVASRVSGDYAYVLLNTGSRSQPYLYGANCICEHGRWFEQGSSNSPGWQGADDPPYLGNLSFWGDAPQGAHAVRVIFEDQTVEESVVDGAYLLVWWQVPRPSEWPRVSAFRIDGVWTPQPGLLGP
jgi:hypothetical protein